MPLSLQPYASAPTVHVSAGRLWEPFRGVVSSSERKGRQVESLEDLRAEARTELDAEIERRCRDGEDPWQFAHELPSVDERVVRILRDDTIAALGLREQRSQAYHPTARPGQAEEFEFGVLRSIALEHPDLTRTVWSMLGRIDPRAA